MKQTPTPAPAPQREPKPRPQREERPAAPELPKEPPKETREEPKEPHRESRLPREKKPREPRPPREQYPAPEKALRENQESRPPRVEVEPNDNVRVRVERSAAYVERILRIMGIENVKVTPKYYEDNVCLQLTGTGLGVIIGRRGETLDSIQYLSSLVANRGEGDYIRINIDSGNYREKRERTLEALARVKKELGLKTVLGVSNISFGLPARPLVNQNFLTMAMTKGLDLPIINPNLDAMMAAVRCYHLLMNIDADARDFIAAYANAAVSTSITAGAGQAAPSAAPAGERTLEQIVLAGLKGEAGPAARRLLEAMDSMAVVDGILIPALDKVGADFEAGKVFLPQLIQAAGAAQAAFEVIREGLQPGADSGSKAPVVLATVKGDIHDIGKNIVKVLLENYGYPVVDLGKDVEPSAVVEAAKKHAAPLVGLSALMTTTLGSMEETIRLLRKDAPWAKVMVGGAVITQEFADQIGADFYAKDAAASTRVASAFFDD